MRELKFRAWGKNIKEYLGGDIPSNVVSLLGELLMQSDWEIEQYAGIKDKNGRDIYEGDIVYLAGYGNCLVKFPFIDLYEACQEGDIGEILGNVHENPEPMEEENG